MLLQRLITALLLLPLLLAAIFFAPTPIFYALICIVGVIAAWEWAQLIPGRTQPQQRLAYAALLAVALAAVWWLPDALQLALMALAVLWWLLALALFRGFPGNMERRPLAPLLMGGLGLLLLCSTMLALARLHALEGGALKLGYSLFIVFAADVGAYLAGRNLGRHKLAPQISPGKTVEGAIGGLLLCAAWALTAGVYVFPVQGPQILLLLALTLTVAVFSVIGDLTESMFKRVAGIKDSGNILPGHGGMLDRVDSILAAAPVMALGLHLTGL